MSQEDPQRQKEKEALRNARGVLDEIEEFEKTEKSRIVSVAFLLVGGLALALALAFAIRDFTATKPDPAQVKKTAEQAQAMRAAIAQSQASYRAGPKRTRIEGATEPRFAAYAETCLARIESLANSKYKQDVANIDGKAKVEMAIRYDGMIDAVEVQSWSGHPAIEPSAKRLVKNAEPCGNFPDDVRNGTDVLHVVTTVNFVKPANGPSVVTIDRPWAKAAP